MMKLITLLYLWGLDLHYL